MKKSNYVLLASLPVAAGVAFGLSNVYAKRFDSEGALHERPAQAMLRRSIVPNLDKALNLLIPRAFGSGTPTAMSTLRSNIFLIVGYPSSAVYEEINSGSDGPPQAGLTGMVKTFIDGITAIAVENGITSCAAVPTTGSYTGTVGGVSATVSFGAPTHSIPTGWTNAGTTYSKRAKLVAGTRTAIVEFMCDRSSAWALLQADSEGDGYTGGTRTLNLYFDFEDADARKLEMAMKVMDDNNECGGSNTCESWLLRAQTGASNQFSLWQSSFAWRATKYQGERILLNGDYSTNQMSAFYTFESNFGTTLASVTGTDQGASTTGLTADATFSSATSADLAKQGCVDFDTPSATLASTTLCSGYSLTAPSTTIFQSSDSADFSYTGLKDVVDNIEDPS